MRTVALLGRSKHSLHMAENSHADEFWGVGVVYRDWEGQLDRVYELHPLWMLQDPAYDDWHFSFLKEGNLPWRLVMQEHYPELPQSEAYPIQGAMALGHNVWRGEHPNRFFTSSLDYMLAAAILEGFERIELYGFDMYTRTEYAYQREGCAFWCGLAAGRGVRVWFHKDNPNLRAKMYGYEIGAQMVGRQRLETVKRLYQEHLERAQAVLNVKHGILTHAAQRYEAERSPENAERFEAARLEWFEAEKNLHRWSGANQTVQFLLDECDLQEPSYDVINKFATLHVSNKPEPVYD